MFEMGLCVVHLFPSFFFYVSVNVFWNHFLTLPTLINEISSRGYQEDPLTLFRL